MIWHYKRKPFGLLLGGFFLIAGFIVSELSNKLVSSYIHSAFSTGISYSSSFLSLAEIYIFSMFSFLQWVFLSPVLILSLLRGYIRCSELGCVIIPFINGIVIISSIIGYLFGGFLIVKYWTNRIFRVIVLAVYVVILIFGFIHVKRNFFDIIIRFEPGISDISSAALQKLDDRLLGINASRPYSHLWDASRISYIGLGNENVTYEYHIDHRNVASIRILKFYNSADLNKYWKNNNMLFSRGILREFGNQKVFFSKGSSSVWDPNSYWYWRNIDQNRIVFIETLGASYDEIIQNHLQFFPSSQ